MAKKKPTFEQAMERIEEITTIIEQGEPSIDELVKLYNEGVELAAYCAEKLKTSSEQVTLLRQKTAEVFTEEAFEV